MVFNTRTDIGRRVARNFDRGGKQQPRVVEPFSQWGAQAQVKE